MSDDENREHDDDDDNDETYTVGAATYTGAIRVRNAKLQEARDQFQAQVDWLNGYLFIVDECLSGENGIPFETALAYLESVPEVILDAEGAINEVERRAMKLYEALASVVERMKEAQPSGGEPIGPDGAHQ